MKSSFTYEDKSYMPKDANGMELPNALESNEYNLIICRIVKDLGICVMLGIVCALLSIITANSIVSSSGETVYVFFASIIIIVLAINYYGYLGIIVALVNSLIFCFALKQPLSQFSINVAINVFQAILVWLALMLFKRKNLLLGALSDNGENSFLILQLIIGIAFIFGGMVTKNTIPLVITFAAIELVLFAVTAILFKNTKRLLLACLLFLLPGVFAGILNAVFQFKAAPSQRAEGATIWALSNFVLLASIGFILLRLVNKKVAAALQNPAKKSPTERVAVRATSMCYYFSALVWNIGFLFMYYFSWLGANVLPYLLPWAIGNVLFLSNLYFNAKQAAGNLSTDDAFDRFEKKAVVAEQNTQFLISIITFLLPLSASLMQTEVDYRIATIFCLNISAACMAIGLIWIPLGRAKIMGLLKSIKTTFHLFTVSLLLLNATMIIIS